MGKVDWSDYNPDFSWQGCLDKAQEIMDRENGRNVDYREAALHAEFLKFWVAAAQVHATNAQTEALRDLVDKVNGQ